MGTSACLYHVRDCTQSQCLKALQKVRSPTAFVSDAFDNWVTIADADGEHFRQEAMEKRAGKVSRLLNADVVITVVYDDDISQYVAFQAGKVVDRFSTPSNGYELFPGIGGRRFRGSSVRLAETFPWFNGQALLKRAFKKECTMESSRLEMIARAFGILENRVLLTMETLRRRGPVRGFTGLKERSPLWNSVRARQGFKAFKVEV